MDKVITRPSTDEYRKGWELVFGKKKRDTKLLHDLNFRRDPPMPDDDPSTPYPTSKDMK